MRLLICGDRDWTNSRLIRKWIEKLKPDVVIHGACRGADLMAGTEAIDLEVPCVIAFPAPWSMHPRAAGPIRNSRMLKEGKPDRVLAFHNHIARSKGTADMVRKATRAGIPCEVVTE